MATRQPFDNRDIARVAVFAALIAVFGQASFNVTGIGVPITLQTLAVMLAGTVLGPTRGLAAVLVMLLLGLAGLPLFAGGSGGPGVFVGPTAGYIYGWIPGVVLTGLIAHSGGRLAWWRVALGALVGGLVVIHLAGIFGLQIFAGLTFQAAFAIDVAFVPGDLVKVVLATLVTVALFRAYPNAFPRSLQRAAAPARPATAE